VLKIKHKHNYSFGVLIMDVDIDITVPKMIHTTYFTSNNKELIVVESSSIIVRNIYSGFLQNFTKQNFITSFHLSNNNVITVENSDIQDIRIIRIHNCQTMTEHDFHIVNNATISSACITLDEKYIVYSENNYAHAFETPPAQIKIIDMSGKNIYTFNTKSFITQLYCIENSSVISIEHGMYTYLPVGNACISLYNIDNSIKELFKSKNEISISSISHDHQYLFIVEICPTTAILSSIHITSGKIRQIYKTEKNITSISVSKNNILLTEDEYTKGHTSNISHISHVKLLDLNTGIETFQYINAIPIINATISHDSNIISILNEKTIPNIHFIFLN